MLLRLALMLTLAAGGALGHDIQGHFAPKPSGSPDQWLYGLRIQGKGNEVINCCTFSDGHGSHGDCREMTGAIDEDGADAALPDGERVPLSRITISPDGKSYRCRHPGQPSHCVFRPKAGV